ncbi:MAG: glycerol-3-phosphate 1-O-acyltransferase PlsY [Bacteroidia bacterium]|nr:glycerol-3-phosphate 1-O-acyltransferase PlsY [Bacteroidia bacterium]
MILVLSLIFLAYLIGSIPTAVWIGKALYGIDIRTKGSGNSGSTNAFRVLGVKAGIAVQIIDILKGVIAISLSYCVDKNTLPSFLNDVTYPLLPLQMTLGISAVVGHVFPILAQFRGGKGINTLLGVMLTINWQIALLCLVVFFIVLWISKFVSLSSICAVFFYPIIILLFNHFAGYDYDTWFVVSGFGIFLFVLYTHRSNIRRLLTHSENKIKIKFHG